MTCISLVVWWPQWRRSTVQIKSATPMGFSMFRQPLAWYVSLFLGFNSLMFYTIISWLPALLVDAGYNPNHAGQIHGLMQLASALASLVVAPLMLLCKNQRVVLLLLALPALVGIVGLMMWVDLAMLWAICIGFAAGAIFVLALSFVGLRVESAYLAVGLSGMAQFIGYVLAATGPSLNGKFYDLTASWTPTLVFCLVITIAMIISGLLAATDKKITAATL